jgi:uncharacterized damage-inducible protein DinB
MANKSLLQDAFAHHVWASLRLIDACLALEPAQLETNVPGTYGSIIDTLRHLVGADAGYLFVLGGEEGAQLDTDGLDLAKLRSVMADDGPAWSALLARDLDPDRVATRHRDDGSESHAPVSIRLAQAIHHGTDHRSQICTALTSLGIEPPEIDVWAFGQQDGRAHQTEPTA